MCVLECVCLCPSECVPLVVLLLRPLSLSSLPPSPLLLPPCPLDVTRDNLHMATDSYTSRTVATTKLR